jgi:prepilin signal peptidase PulO-like enzyme (type II secretory pathway)
MYVLKVCVSVLLQLVLMEEKMGKKNMLIAADLYALHVWNAK